MKFKYNKIACLFLSMLISSSSVSMVQAQENSKTINKDETVYTMLNHDGSVQNIEIINRLYDVKDTTTIDFGNYLEVSPLRNAPLPEINNNKVIWDTADYIGKDFYYEGTIDKDLPIVLDINYFLDGTEIEASQIAGKTGEIKIVFHVKQNPDCQESYKESYMTQIQLTLDLDNNIILSADNAINTVAGKYSTLAYTVMPNEDKTFELVLHAENFELQPINIALIKNSISLDSFDDLIDGLDDMEHGTNELAKGTKELQNGMVDLVNGLGDLNDGVGELSNGSAELKNGLAQYKDGLTEFKTGTESLANGMNDASLGLTKLNEQSSLMVEGYSKLYTGLNELKAGHNQLTQIANSLLANPDPSIQALAQGIIVENEALMELTTGFTASNEGLKSYTAGINELSTGFNLLNEGMAILPVSIEELVTGYEQLYGGYVGVYDGLNQTNNGINKMYKNVNSLPSDVNKLVNGQEELAAGVGEFNDKLSESLLDTNTEETVSFADSNTEIHSLQFIMKTPDIKVPDTDDISINDNVKEKESWYKEILNKFIALFNTNKF